MSRYIDQFVASSLVIGLCMLNTSMAAITDGKYSVNQVFDCQRSPAYPVAGNPFALSNFAQPFKDVGGQYTLGAGEYIKFFYTTGDKVGIKRYDAAGNELETISADGKVWGLEQEGFLYVSTLGDWGTFVSNNQGYSYGDGVTYTPSKAQATKADLDAYNASSTPLGDGETASEDSEDSGVSTATNDDDDDDPPFPVTGDSNLYLRTWRSRVSDFFNKLLTSGE